MKKIFALLTAVVLCVSLFAGCGGEITTANDKELNESVVGKVGNIKVTQADYNFIYNLIYAQLDQSLSQYMGANWVNIEMEEGKTYGEYVTESAKTQLEQFLVATIIAEEKGLDTDPSTGSQKKELIESYGGETQFRSFLESSHTTDKAIDAYLRTYANYDTLYGELTKEGEAAYVDDDETLKKFKEEKMRVQHILVSTQEQTDAETGEAIPAKTDEEAQKIVKEILAKLKKGEDFDKLIDEYNEDPGLTSGNYYVFGEGEMVAEFEEASKNLKVGEYTKEAVKTSYGYHIIKKYELTKDIEEFTAYKESFVQEKLTEIFNKKLETVKVTWNDKVLDKYLTKWAEERAAAAGTTVTDQSISLPTDEELEAMENADAEGEEADSAVDSQEADAQKTETETNAETAEKE